MDQHHVTHIEVNPQKLDSQDPSPTRRIRIEEALHWIGCVMW